ncbi:hypothetical protein [Legionella sainthelensi]|uniref:hypothetical protein n=1 Tax=Legionella sainthelensi TaxID=28087 RepID=UPI000EF33626|nr:hypothetical protein [Legionella sainthelensi]AUH73526.2 hypothetical protein CAB17_16840 [Legionella sainthelensi]
MNIQKYLDHLRNGNLLKVNNIAEEIQDKYQNIAYGCYLHSMQELPDNYGDEYTDGFIYCQNKLYYIGTDKVAAEVSSFNKSQLESTLNEMDQQASGSLYLTGRQVNKLVPNKEGLNTPDPIFSKLGADDITPLIIYELCKTDLAEKDLDLMKFYEEVMYASFENSQAVLSCIATLQIAMKFAVILRKDSDYCTQLDSETQLNDKKAIQAFVDKRAPFALKLNSLTMEKDKTIADPTSYLKQNIGQMNYKTFFNLLNNVTSMRRDCEGNNDIFQLLDDHFNNKMHDKLSALITSKERIKTDIFINQVRDAKTIERVADGKTLYDLALDNKLFDIAKTLNKKHTELKCNEKIPDKEYIKDLAYCKKIQAKTDRLRSLGEKIILDSVSIKEPIKLQGKFLALKEKKITLDELKSFLEKNNELYKIDILDYKIAKAFEVIQKAQNLDDLILKYQNNRISSSNKITLDEFKKQSTDILNTENHRPEDSFFTKIKEIVNSIRISINIYRTAQDISNSSLNQKEIRQVLKEYREQQSEPKNEGAVQYSF